MIKRILIICKYFYPDITPRSLRASELAAELARQGHNVTVLTKYRDEKEYLGLNNRNKLWIKSFGKLNLPQIKIDYKNKLLRYISRAIRRLLNLLFEYPDIEMMFKVKKALKTEMDYDLLISIAVPYPIHWGVALAKTKNNRIAKKWIADCGDPYMGEKTDSFRKLWYFKYIEKWFMHNADFISIPIENAKDGYYKEFHNKIRIIPQGFDFKVLQLSEYIKNDIPTFAYAGSFIPNQRDPSEFLQYLSELKTNFKFIIYTEQDVFLLKYKDRLGEKLEIRNYITRTKLLYELSKMDFLINFDNNTQIQSPSKLIDYSLTKRPIINLTSSFEKKTIEEFLDGNYSKQFEIHNIDKYDIKEVAYQFMNVNNK